MAFTLEVKVIPGAHANRWLRDKSGALKCFIKSPAEKGKANDELIALVSQILKIPKNCMMIVCGATTRKKLIRIDSDHTIQQFLSMIGL